MCLFACVQADDNESQEEQEPEEDGVTFIAHVPVPSQKEVRTNMHVNVHILEDLA